MNESKFTVEECIWIFRGESPDGMTGEFQSKAPILECLTQRLPDSRVLDFFLEVIANPAECSKARLHLLKLFEAGLVPEARSRVAACVCAALPGEDDLEVACALSRLVALYSDTPVARAVAIERALDPDEDEGVRLHCLEGLRGADPQAAAALRRLAAENSPVGRVARDRLAGAT